MKMHGTNVKINQVTFKIACLKYPSQQIFSFATGTCGFHKMLGMSWIYEDVAY
jgi:hypothetical protein